MVVPTDNNRIFGLKRLLQRGGFTLIELAIVITVVGVLSVPLMGLYSHNTEQRNRSLTKERMEEIRKAMAQYYYAYHKYPCPTPLARPEDASLDLLACKLDDDTDRDAARKLGLFVYDDGSGKLVVTGSVPYRYLNIGKDKTLDGWGNLLVYTVSYDSTHETALPGTGKVGIVDEQGRTLINPPGSAIWAVLSHGANRLGAYSGQGDQNFPCPSGGLDAQNCSYSGQYVVSPYSQAKANFYDDLVYYQSWAEIPDSVATPYCMTQALQKEDSLPSVIQEGSVLRLCGEQPGGGGKATLDGDGCGFYICRSGNILPFITNLYP